MRREDGVETIYSRREFGKLALVGLPLSVMLGQTKSKIDSKFDGVRIGVQSYSFRTMSLDDAIKAMVQIGIGECELFATVSELIDRLGSVATAWLLRASAVQVVE